MIAEDATAAAKREPQKKRGNYNCGRCGLPKKGHVCSAADGPALPPRSDSRLRRALSFDDDRVSAAPTPEEVAAPPESVVGREDEEEEGREEAMMVVVVGGAVVLPVSCMAEVLRRLSPKELMGAAAVCRGWRECVRRVWRSAEELRVRVSPRSQIGFVGSVLHKCAALARLTLRMERLGRFLDRKEDAIYELKK